MVFFLGTAIYHGVGSLSHTTMLGLMQFFAKHPNVTHRMFGV
jgi:hypothetical protein